MRNHTGLLFSLSCQQLYVFQLSTSNDPKQFKFHFISKSQKTNNFTERLIHYLSFIIQKEVKRLFRASHL